MNVTPFHKLQEEANEVQEFLDCEIQSDNVEEIKERGDALAVYISRTGNMLAEAKYHLNGVMKDEAMKLIEETLLKEKHSAKVQNTLVDGLAKEQKFLVDKIDRLNNTAKHQIDWCRSRLSLAKEEMINARGWNK